MALRLYGNGNIENIDYAASNIATSSDLSLKKDIPLFCLVSDSGNLPSMADGVRQTFSFDTISINKSGFSLDASNNLIIPKTSLYEITLSFESSISGSTYNIRALRATLAINQTVYGQLGAKFHTVAKTFSNTHYTKSTTFFVNLNAGDFLGYNIEIYHDKGSSLTDSYWTVMHVREI
jgi:hypothetical protein